jgi:pimeloyl-ACP methyl ester carboxylesterase
MNKQKVYFLPGTMCDERLWQKVWPKISTAIEPQHISLTEGKNFQELDQLIAEQLEEEQIHLVGFSMGGYAALHFALNHQEKIKSLVIIGASARGLNEEEIELRNTFMEVLRNQPYNGVSKGRIQQLLSPLNRNDQEIIRIIRQMDKDLGKEILISQVTATTNRPSLMDRLPELNLPVMLIFGKQEALVSFEEIKSMSQLLPDCKTKLIENSGHMVPLENPEVLADLLQEWIGENDRMLN